MAVGLGLLIASDMGGPAAPRLSLAPSAPPVTQVSHPVAPHEREQEQEDNDNAAGGDDFLFRIRAFPFRHIPRGARARAFEQANRLRAPREFISNQNASSSADSSQQWTLIGPRPTFNNSSGRVTAIAIDPNDNKTVYLGGAEGGVWKTTDGGTAWTPLTDSQPTLSIGSLAIDPANSNIIYAGTGEANLNGDSYGGMGILKSTDGGKTWSLLGANIFDGLHIGALAIEKDNPQVILAASEFGLYRSTDGGATWLASMFDSASAVLFDPSSPSVAYAALIGLADATGIYKSLDGGATWNISDGAGTTATAFPSDTIRISLAISASQPKTLLAGAANADGPLTGLYQTKDGGNTWTLLSGFAYCAKQCWYNNVVAISPTDPNLVLAGGVVLEVSNDGGKTWATAPGSQNIHVDQHAIAFTADGSSVYLGNDGGVWTSVTASGGFGWFNLNATLALTQFYGGVSTQPGNPAIAVGGTQDNSSLQFANSQWRTVSCGDGAATAIDPINPQNVYISCGGGVPPGEGLVQASTVGGAAGTYRNADSGISEVEGAPFVPYLTIDPTNPKNLYFTGNQHIYQTTNSAHSWASISPDVTADILAPCAIAVSPSDSNTVYSGSCDGVVMVTHNALSGTASTWQNISAGLPLAGVTHISADPGSRMKAYATLSGFGNGHVFVTSDGGQTWVDISANLPDISANDLVIDPDIAGTLYVATDAGVFWTNNYGGVWSAIGAGLPQAAVLSLGMEHTTRTLRAATHGRSVWDLIVPVKGLNLIPLISSASPKQIPLNTSIRTLTVTGSNFAASSEVLWNQARRPTTFVSASQITASLTSADVGTDSLATVSVFTPGPGGGTSAQSYVKVGTNPAIYPLGLVNGASFSAGAGVAPGSIVSVFGVDMAPQLATFDSVPLPKTLAGASLSLSDPASGFNGLAPLYFVSGGQMNIQVPWEANPGATDTFTPAVSGANGAGVNVNVQFFAPGIFTADQSGKGQGSILNASTGTLAAPVGKYNGSHPVKRGEYISIYCTGLGLVDNPPADGAPSPSSPPANTAVQPFAIVGGAFAPPSFSGLAPGFIGLNQVNVQIPADAPTGDAVTIFLTDGFTNSNTVTIAIQ